MGEDHSSQWSALFNKSVKVQFSDQRLTSDAGVLILREVDSQLGLLEGLADQLHDPRHQRRIRYRAVELLRERVYAMSLGYSAQDDVDRLAHDPGFRMAVWDRPGDAVLEERLASQPTQSRLLGILANDRHNLNMLRQSLVQCVERHLRGGDRDQRVRRGTIDLDSFPIEVHGKQSGANYNGYYRCTAYHPLVASFSVAGDYDSTRVGQRLGNGFIHAILRQGSVHTAAGAGRFIRNVIHKARRLAAVVDFRIDAGYTIGPVMDALSDEGVKFVGRLKGNSRLDALAEPHLQRPAGRPPREGYEFCVDLGWHHVDTWRHSQRLILVVVDRPDPKTGQLNLQPDYFFLVTNWLPGQRSAEQLLEHYRPRGTFEDRLGEFNQAIGCHLSSGSFHENEATLLLAMLAYNLVSTARIELEDDVGGCWDLRRFQNYVLKAAGRVVKHSRRLVIRVAKSVQGFWERLFRRISNWQLPERFGAPRGATRGAFRPPPAHAHLSEVLRH